MPGGIIRRVWGSLGRKEHPRISYGMLEGQRINGWPSRDGNLNGESTVASMGGINIDYSYLHRRNIYCQLQVLDGQYS